MTETVKSDQKLISIYFLSLECYHEKLLEIDLASYFLGRKMKHFFVVFLENLIRKTSALKISVSADFYCHFFPSCTL